MKKKFEDYVRTVRGNSFETTVAADLTGDARQVVDVDENGDAKVTFDRTPKKRVTRKKVKER